MCCFLLRRKCVENVAAFRRACLIPSCLTFPLFGCCVVHVFWSSSLFAHFLLMFKNKNHLCFDDLCSDWLLAAPRNVHQFYLSFFISSSIALFLLISYQISFQLFKYKNKNRFRPQRQIQSF